MESNTLSGVRLARLRAMLTHMGLDALSVRDTSNIFWLTAFDNVFDDEQAHTLFVDDEHAILHTDSRYDTACLREAHAQGDLVHIDSKPASSAAFVRKAWGSRSGVLGIEDAIALREYRALQKAFSSQGEESNACDGIACTFAETDGVVKNLRAVKDVSEIERLKAAQAITDAAFSHIIGFMKPGMTEREVQIELEDYMYRHGAQGLAFTSIVACGANGASPHAIAGSARLEAGQCVVLDFGARVNGYNSDMTRTVFLGAPCEIMRAAWDTIREANESVEAQLAPGVTGKQAHELAEQILAEHGFGGKMGHGLGHGVGVDIHEEPVLSPRNEKPLVAGNVVTVEPGIYLPGQFGMRLEDFGVITEHGFEVFTQSTHEMVVL